MADLRSALAPVMVEVGRDPSVAVIAFTGGGEKLQLPVYEFFDTTRSLQYSRILLWDRFHRQYERGIDDERPDFASLMEYLRAEVARLKPEKLLCVGTSAGGTAAMRAGHLLRADYVHAFAPQTGDHPLNASLGRSRFWPWRNGAPRKEAKRFFDLTRILQEWNGKTLYYVHYGRACATDRVYADRLRHLAGVVTIGYSCDTHLIAVFLAKKGFLTKALSIANQESLVEIAKMHFGNDLEVNDGRRSAPGRPE